MSDMFRANAEKVSKLFLLHWVSFVALTIKIKRQEDQRRFCYSRPHLLNELIEASSFHSRLPTTNDVSIVFGENLKELKFLYRWAHVSLWSVLEMVENN